MQQSLPVYRRVPPRLANSTQEFYLHCHEPKANDCGGGMCGLQNGLSLSRQKHQTCLRCAEFFRVSLDECEANCCFHILITIPLRLPSWLIRFYWDNIVSIKFQESIIYIGSNDELQLYTSKSCSSPLN